MPYDPITGKYFKYIPPQRVYASVNTDGEYTYWQIIPDKTTITIPEYIEGTAKNTIKMMYGAYYRLIKEPR